MTPTLQTQRHVLRPYTVADISARHIKWLNDPRVVAYSEQRHTKHTLETQRDFVQFFPADSHIWLIEDTQGVQIGTMTAYVDGHNLVANLGIMIGDVRYWGQARGLEIWNEVVRLLFDTGTQKIEAGCMTINTAMSKICVRSGMRLEGTKAAHFLYDNARVDLLMYGKQKP